MTAGTGGAAAPARAGGSLLDGSLLVGVARRLVRGAPGRLLPLPEPVPRLPAAAFLAVLGLMALAGGRAFAGWTLGSVALALVASVRPRAALLVVAAATTLGTKVALGGRLLPVRAEDLLFAGTLLGLLHGRRAREIPDPPLLGPLLGAGAFLAFEAFRAVALGNAFRAEPLLLLARTGAYALLYLVVARDVAREGARSAYALALLLGGALLAAFGIAEQLVPQDFLPFYVYRSFDRGPLASESNHVGAELAGLSALAVALVLRHPRRGMRVLAALAVPLLLLGLASSGSRQAWVAGAAAMLVVVARGRPIAFPLAVAAILLPASRLGPGGRLWTLLTDLSPAAQPSTSGYDRMLNWKAALLPLVDRPLLGAGLGSWWHGFYESQWVQVLAELGAIGLLLAVALVVHVGWLLARRVPDEPAEAFALRLGALGFLVVLVLQGAATLTFLTAKSAGPFAVLLGAALAPSLRRVRSPLRAT